MTAITQCFERLQAGNQAALVGFVTAGDPDFQTSAAIVKAMCEGGLDILELGIPFSDPTADGPVIQRSSLRALRAGMTLSRVLDLVTEIRKFSPIPIILFGYYNPVFRYGGGRFCTDALAAGASGTLLVDLPPEESPELTTQWNTREFDLIRLVAPTTGPDRLPQIVTSATGFIYLVSLTGVTGSQGMDLALLPQIRARIRELTDLPVCVGFGISTPEQVRAVCKISDGVVAGSVFERLIEEHPKSPDLCARVTECTRGLKAATLRH
jgi:tryptophan synthase alpha chain